MKWGGRHPSVRIPSGCRSKSLPTRHEAAIVPINLRRRFAGPQPQGTALAAKDLPENKKSRSTLADGPAFKLSLRVSSD